MSEEEELSSVWLCVERRGGGIEGVGIFATKNIEKDDLIAIKGGRIINRTTYDKYAEVINGSHHQIEDGLYLAGITPEEVNQTLIGYNHSCEPNSYVSGQIELRALRPIAKGEEVTADYATVFSDDTQTFKCNCGSQNCRKFVNCAEDWKKPEIQQKYNGYFAAYLQRKIFGQKN
jgi:uncharacterized protein